MPSLARQLEPRRPDAVFSLLLTLSQFEATLRDMFKSLLKGKQAKWDLIRLEGSAHLTATPAFTSLPASDRMKELSDVFSGATPLTRVEKNETLQRLTFSLRVQTHDRAEYFQNLSSQIAALDFSDSTSAGRKITHLQSVRETRCCQSLLSPVEGP